MQRNILFTFFFLIGIAAHVRGSCQDYTDCDSCAKHVGQFLGCRWCVTTNKCNDFIATGACDEALTVTDPYDCPMPPRSGYGYTDSFARFKVLPLISAAQSDNPQACLTNAMNGAKLKRQLSVPCDSKGDTCSGYTATSNYDKAIIASFQGTKGTWQAILEVLESFEAKKPFVAGGNVAEYFYNGFYAVWNAGMKDDLLTLKAANPDYELWVVGHSLGGSLASLCAALVIKLNMWPAEKVKLVTFGQPRTGDIDYAKAHDQLLYYGYRVVHHKDPVPHIPLRPFGNFHHRYEVWYNNNMTISDTFELCTRSDDDTCSNAGFNLLDLEFSDHLHYFNQDVSGWGNSGCTN
uniref:Fungal lipase-like domain-containing protein n=1 Tax=Plectus sambesii TaxID=2011161 RepID=A0A914WCC5_9BILA